MNSTQIDRMMGNLKHHLNHFVIIHRNPFSSSIDWESLGEYISHSKAFIKKKLQLILHTLQKDRVYYRSILNK